MLALGDTTSAERTATGDIDGAARDYNIARGASDEPWIEQHALDGLEAIDRPVEEDME